MPVHSLADVQSFLSHARKKVLKRVESCLPELLTWRPAPGRWSVLEHLEHLAYSERNLVAKVCEMAAELRRQGLTARADTPRNVDAMPALAAAGALTRKFVAPETSQPTGKPLDVVLGMLSESRAQAEAVLGELAELDTDRLQVDHMSGARFNAAQFMHFIGLHELLHESHMARNAEEWEAAQRNAG